MKTAIIILAILTVVFWVAYKIFYAATMADPLESMKLAYGGGSILAFISGLCRLLCWLCGAAVAILLLIMLL